MGLNSIMISSTKMLKILIDGQKSIRNDITEVKEEVKKNGTRIDKLGLQIARLEDDAPTIEEFDKLEKRVTKVERKLQIQTPA